MDLVGVPKLKSVGRSVLLEDDEGQDFATNAERLLKLVDQDFADVIGVLSCHPFPTSSDSTMRTPLSC